MTKAKVFGAIMTGLAMAALSILFGVNWIVCSVAAGVITYVQLSLEKV